MDYGGQPVAINLSRTNRPLHIYGRIDFVERIVGLDEWLNEAIQFTAETATEEKARRHDEKGKRPPPREAGASL